MTAELKNEALSYLESHHVMTLSTTGVEGPWAAALFYVNDGFNLFFLTENHTRHGRNLTANPQVALAVQEDYHEWREIKGIQILGEVKPVPLWEKAKVLHLFISKFPSVSTFISDPKYVAIVARSLIYRIHPREIWYLDNKKGFSHREMIIP